MENYAKLLKINLYKIGQFNKKTLCPNWDCKKCNSMFFIFNLALFLLAEKWVNINEIPELAFKLANVHGRITTTVFGF